MRSCIHLFMRSRAACQGTEAFGRGGKPLSGAFQQGFENRAPLPDADFCNGSRPRYVHTAAPLTPEEGCVCGLLVCNQTRCPAATFDQWETTSLQADNNLAPYLASDWASTDAILDRIGFTPGLSLVDVGAGDGRVLLQAAHRGASEAVGYELSEDVFRLGLEHIQSSGLVDVPGRIVLIHEDGLMADLTRFDVIFAFLLPRGLALMGDRLAHLMDDEERDSNRASTTVVTRGWGLPGERFQSNLSYQFVLPGGAPVFVYNI